MRILDADAVIAFSPFGPQLEALAGRGEEVHSIGDCAAPRLAVMAIYEGRELGMRL